MDRKKPEIVTIASIKGGVGKSTSTIILSTILSQKHKVLLIDIDTQASATSYFFKKIKEQNFKLLSKNIYEILKGNIDINNSIINISNNLDLIPSYLTLHKFNSESIPFKEIKLQEQLTFLEVNYDYIIIDTNPSLDITLINALVVSDYILVPITAEKWSIESLELLEFFVNKLNLTKIPIFLINIRFKKNNTHKYLLKLLAKKDNFLGIISEREDLNKRIARNMSFDLTKDYIYEYVNALEKFLENKG
ncbi:ParA family protein [Borrelia miyamotoi]|uniref:ParA family protein n=1 Tax=Borrelia miyamotoi TaxID=47466 RepID=A0AAQ2WWY5_9SPIR|nr:ParA family protein [Borrelia miyamotoi]QTL83986.1 ParA family protein [Borrelia miyamotoi]WAZ85621.1 ParA family protein [Borrelia miyamotoi]WAZ91405.1 ParA family protein [Borrelia miyamotoi]WAZ92691.1 ParA family protein [Borrelia miyamotoi]WAZ93982.1 ParA family protein [Borrelia miyamotoi]